MTRTKLRRSYAERAAQFVNDAVALTERDACLVCRASETQVVGHSDCWRLVRIAREIRKLGQGKP